MKQTVSIWLEKVDGSSAVNVLLAAFTIQLLLVSLPYSEVQCPVFRIENFYKLNAY